jgi:hypothetical protein
MVQTLVSLYATPVFDEAGVFGFAESGRFDSPTSVGRESWDCDRLVIRRNPSGGRIEYFPKSHRDRPDTFNLEVCCTRDRSTLRNSGLRIFPDACARRPLLRMTKAVRRTDSQQLTSEVGHQAADESLNVECVQFRSLK